MATIYVVEDDETLQELYKLHLTQKGHQVVGQAKDGNEALIDLYFNFHPKPPDVLIIDYKMPGKNGIELLQDIRKLNICFESKIFFITGIPKMESEAKDLGVTKYIKKPIRFSTLHQNISSAITD